MTMQPQRPLDAKSRDADVQKVYDFVARPTERHVETNAVRAQAKLVRGLGNLSGAEDASLAR